MWHLKFMWRKEMNLGFSGETCRKETIWKTKVWIGEIINMDIKEMGWEVVDWLNLGQNMDH
jgi:hypothetical protein